MTINSQLKTMRSVFEEGAKYRVINTNEMFPKISCLSELSEIDGNGKVGGECHLDEGDVLTFVGRETVNGEHCDCFEHNGVVGVFYPKKWGCADLDYLTCID